MISIAGTELQDLAAGLGVVATLFGGGWILGRTLAHGQIRILYHERNEARKQAQDLMDDLRKISAASDRSSEDVAALKAENAVLRAAAESGANGPLIKELQARDAKFKEFRDALMGDEAELWRLRPPVPPADFENRIRNSRLKVFMIANLKGGVGKTTLTANLAAYFALKRGKRVLLIDFDYQGSLTRTMLTTAHITLGSTILVDALLDGRFHGADIAKAGRDLSAVLKGARLFTSGQTFDRVENRLMMRWLVGEESSDVRYRLAELLLSKPVQDEFDIVLIDAPPRLSLGTLNALCASHAILVPTILDALSVDAVGQFLLRANAFRPLNKGLEFAGVIASNTSQTALTNDEQMARDSAKLALADWHGRSHMFAHNIRYFTALAKAAGRGIGYVDNAAVRNAFIALGDEIAEQMNL